MKKTIAALVIAGLAVVGVTACDPGDPRVCVDRYGFQHPDWKCQKDDDYVSDPSFDDDDYHWSKSKKTSSTTSSKKKTTTVKKPTTTRKALK
ncbi:hypothetical protein SEA_NEDARYA_69 [Gordonia phage Nedarya]|nr:hypothetical protein SEA_NEDARYA_69 [Gordonia phage Nedarya]